MSAALGILRQGGWVMFPIGLASLLAVTIVIERAIALRRRVVIDPRVLGIIEDYSGEASAERCLNACQHLRAPFARVIEDILKTRHLDLSQIMETMNLTGRSQISVLERGLTVLEIIGNTGPLLGLLGTVLGMISMFNAVTLRGLGNPQVLSDGIAKALVTTVGGLCVAIPAVAFHSWYCRRVDDLAAEMQDRATGFIFKMQSLRKSGR
ncbi:MAG: MotA/TolQ/ExbB proton channel family protein [Candidatus Hydrogenedentes bacterium]|nr:MotA/TolQ/ExbB proton channel family protein [Candidatus Hydrogenedentota bacterium]